MRRHNKKVDVLLVGRLSDEPANGGNRLIYVWCPYCKKTHIHGWDKDYHPLDVSHRGAHCMGDSPLREGGYFIGLEPRHDKIDNLHAENELRALLAQAEATIRKQAKGAEEVETFFKTMRFDPERHGELGDIRLTLGQQEELIDRLKL